MYTRVMALIIKEILTLLKDVKARGVLIAPPIIQLFIFAWAATLDVQNVPIGILNRDNGEKAIELAQRFHGSPMFSHIVYLKSVEEIAPFIDSQQGIMVISIDQQFSRNVDAGKPGQVQLILDGRKSNTAQIVLGYASEIVQQFNSDISPQIKPDVRGIEIVSRNWYNPNLLYYWYNVPCLAAIITMTVGFTVTAMSIAREREMGTFDQLMVSPLQPFEIMLGKLIPAIIVALAEGTIIIVAGIYVFNIPFAGSLPLMYFALFVFVCSIAGVGLFISSLCSTQQQAILGSFVFMSPAISLSGFATPIENMPVFLQHMTLANPLRYMLVIAKGLFLKAMPAEIVLSNIWPMALIAVFTLSCATWFFRHRLE